MSHYPTHSSKGWKIGVDSAYKLIIYFHNQQQRTFYSMDWQHAKARKDPSLGLARLHKLLKEYEGLFQTALLYDLTTNEEIERHPPKTTTH